MNTLGWIAMFFPGVLLIDELEKRKITGDDIVLWRLFMIILALMLAFHATGTDSKTSAGQAIFFSAVLVQWLR